VVNCELILQEWKEESRPELEAAGDDVCTKNSGDVQTVW